MSGISQFQELFFLLICLQHELNAGSLSELFRANQIYFHFSMGMSNELPQISGKASLKCTCVFFALCVH